MQWCHGWCQCAPILVQTATGHEGLETCGNSIPIIHSVFHNSVENQAPKMPQALVLCNFPSRNAVDISVEVQEKIKGLLRGLAENGANTFHVPQANFWRVGEQNPAYIRVRIRPSRKFLRQGSLCLFRRKCKNSVNKQSRKKTFTNSSCSCRRSITYWRANLHRAKRCCGPFPISRPTDRACHGWWPTEIL